jgi:phosphatidylethanolamine/phosphatidyl-N-methylethanolamine N-methyltransferase
MTNRWNRFIYRLWAPIYDRAVERIFRPGRERAIQLLALQPGEQVLLVGVGTGADLPLLPVGATAVGIDLSSSMLARARSKLPLEGRAVTLIEGDAQSLLVPEATFDAVIFNLILSVIPDGRACLRENLRALKPQGRAVVFDKFAPEGKALSLSRRVLNIFSRLIGTEITRLFDDMLAGSEARIVIQEASILNGNYQIYLLGGSSEAI